MWTIISLMALTIALFNDQSVAQALNKRALVFKDFQKNTLKLQKSSRLADLPQYANIGQKRNQQNSYGTRVDKDYQDETRSSYEGQNTVSKGRRNGNNYGNSNSNYGNNNGNSYGNGKNNGKGGIQTYGGCRALSKTTTDFWCNVNCIGAVSYCPKKFCKCPW